MSSEKLTKREKHNFWVGKRVCVCERKRENDCVCEGGRGGAKYRARNTEIESKQCVRKCVCVCVCVCVRERERELLRVSVSV